jgi:3-hydroxyisobutyrate dehydrogenase-like beta-hydroxyacid dehydrogenase
VANTLLAVTCEAYVVGARAGTWESRRAVTRASERIVPEQVATRKFAHGKRIVDACREFALLTEEARRLGVACWVLEKAGVLYRLAAEMGSPADGITRLATHYTTWAGAQVRAGTKDTDEVRH